MAPSATVPIANQLAPLLLEYCHAPCVTALAVLPTTAMPPKLEPASGSENWPLKIVLTVCPAGLAVSSLTAASVPLPNVGAAPLQMALDANSDVSVKAVKAALLLVAVALM